MKKIAIGTFLVLTVFALAAAPASACNQLCRYSASGDQCVTVGWTTWQSCYMVGLSCIDYQCDSPASNQSSETVAFAPAENMTPAATCASASAAAAIYSTQ